MTEFAAITGPTLELLQEWPFLEYDSLGPLVDVVSAPAHMLSPIGIHLHARDWRLGTIVASQADHECVTLRYCFYRECDPRWIHVLLYVDRKTQEPPSLTPIYISADRHEREIEDLFSVRFASHPRLGDFVLHDDKWAEGIGLMRLRAAGRVYQTARAWKPHRVLHEEGAFMMPVGPVFSGHAESALYLLETVGEDVVRAVPRLFYKYRAIEKLAEGRSIHDALLLVERCNGTSAFGNGWGYCNAVETALDIDVPGRANVLRTLLAELERLRHHAGAIRDICESTALSVAANEAAVYEEELLRASERLTGHRYLFGMLAVGGLMRDLASTDIAEVQRNIGALWSKLARLRDALERTSSFLDRIERIGIITPEKAKTFELLGPMARASALTVDMRVSHPYGSYDTLNFSVPTEIEGDGFARLRVLFAEIEQSVHIMSRLSTTLQGAVRVDVPLRRSRALGWTEAPRGTSLHWVELSDECTLLRYHFVPPSFRNWHGFHIATEDFAFQDFPIILATLDLSVAENDR